MDMNCMKRAICYIRRKRVKSLLLLLIFFVSEVTILGTLSIMNASIQIKQAISRQTNTKVRAECIAPDKGITDEEIAGLSEMENVDFVNRAVKADAVADSFAPMMGGDEDVSGKVVLHGYDSLEKDGPFAENTCRLVQGKYPEKDNEMVINQFLAEAGNIHIGDEISFITEKEEDITAVVSGLFRTGTERQQTEKVTGINRVENQFYTTASFIRSFEDCDYEMAVMYMENPDRLDETAEQIERLLGDKVEIRKSDAYYQKLKYCLVQVERVTRLLFVLTVIVSSFILFMLLIMWMRNRKVEMAVFISMGISKGEVFVQMLLEILLVYSLGSIFAVGFSAVCAPGLSKIVGSIEGAELTISLSARAAGLVWLAGIFILTGITFLAMLPTLQKRIKDTLSEMEG